MIPLDAESARMIDDVRRANAARLSRVVARGAGVPSWPVVVDVPLVKGGQGRSDEDAEWYGTVVAWLQAIALVGLIVAGVVIAGRGGK